MSKKSNAARTSSVKADATYRGVRIQPPAGKSRFSDEEIERAIEAAIKKNPDVFAKKT